MEIRQNVLRDLMTGQVICRISDAAGFEFLSDPDLIADIEAVLEPFGVCVTMTSQNHGFLAVEASAEMGSKQLKASYEALAKEARRIEDIAEFLLNVFPDGQRLHIGQIIEASKILDIVNGSNALIDHLAQLTAGLSMTSNTTSKRLSNLLLKLSKDGYLSPVNLQKETYCVTGKTEHMWDVIENFARMIPGIETQLATMDGATQRDLFQ